MILNNKKGKFLIFLVIILVVSITPASAGLANASNGNVNTIPKIVIPSKSEISDDNETSLKTIEQDTNEIQNYADSLDNDLNYVKHRADDYNWKFWKWPKITKDILKTVPQIINTSDKLKGSVDKLNNEVENLGSSLEVDSDSYINNVDNPKCEKDARAMADKLTDREGTTFTVKNINAGELKKGDIVQYLSQDKYPRYLAVQEIKTNNNTGRQILGNSPTDTPITIQMLVLKGTGDKIIEVPLTGECIELSPANEVNTENALQNTVYVQQENIDKTENSAHKAQTKAHTLNGIKNVFNKATIFCAVVGVVLLAAGTASVFICPPLAIPMIDGSISITLVGIILGSVSMVLLKVYDKFTNMANKLESSAGLNEKDLNTYTKIEEKIPYNMNITTFDGIPIVKQPPVNDWKELQFLLVKSPEHGDLLPGPGLQFLYGPYEGYTGEDHFEFEFRGKDGKMGHVTVNIRINPIPVLEIPKEV